MSDVTRRGFVKDSAGAAAGLTVLGALLADDASARKQHKHAGSEPVVAYIRNPRKGEISVMTRHREVRVRDRKLAAEIERKLR